MRGRERQIRFSADLRKVAITGLVLSIIVMSLAPVNVQAASLVSPLPWLHVEANRIVDENGAQVILRGVAIEEQCDMSETGRHVFSEADVVELVGNWHLNVIRVPILPDLWESHPNYAKQFLDPIVDWGNKYGIYTLLDWHAIGNPITGQTNVLDYSGPPFHGNPFNPNSTLAKSFWDSVAERYKNDSWVIYSIFNEPSYITWKEWRPIAEQLVDVVQSHNTKALVFVSGVSWGYDLRDAGLDPVARGNIVYETHPYPRKSIYYGPWDTCFGYLADYHPVFAGEWGFQPGDPDPGLNSTAVSYGKPLLTYMMEKNISWTAWCWSSYWDPVMLQNDRTPSEFGQLVKDFLTNPPTLTVLRRS